MGYQLRTIKTPEVARLEPLYRELARYHNEVSAHFGGSYPSVPIEDQLRECAEDLAAGKAEVAVIEKCGELIALCKVDVVGNRGYLDELVVMPGHRGQGLGSRLMDWADGVFRARDVRQVELRVIVGNGGARRLYERMASCPRCWRCGGFSSAAGARRRPVCRFDLPWGPRRTSRPAV